MPEWQIYGAGEDAQHVVSSGGAGFNVALSPPHPINFQIANLYVGFLVGSFGDERHRFGHFQFGTKPRLQFAEASPAGFYFTPRLLYTLSELREQPSNIAHSLSIGGGLGFNLADGLIGLEFTAEAAYALTDDFRASGATEATLWKPRATSSVVFDVCFLMGQQGTSASACRYAPATTPAVDLTQVVMVMAARLRTAQDPTSVCGAASRGVSLHPRPDEPCRGFEVDDFFCRVKHHLPGAPDLPVVEQAESAHQALAACFKRNRRDALEAAKNDWLLKRKLQYSPSPPELRRAMGCETGAQAYEVPEQDELDPACEACPEACRLLYAHP
jgi:hypothetical protein